ncbi:MAG: phosphate regulon transcriptional regulator PhoB [Hyphomicrobiaceae bacterium]|nr:phosphate regulon transcriptional regulator PhoB [Hyphomicrobiaceae bacterium]
MPARLLIVEDDEALVTLLEYNFEARGYESRVARTSDEAIEALADEQVDLVILDWMLPGGSSGIEVCRRIRARPQTRAIPVIMLTARGEEADRVRGLTTGADDYVVKPFSVAELAARVEALLRRSAPERIANEIVVGTLKLDRNAHRVTRNGREVRLGPTEYRLLEVLLESVGRVLSRAQLLDAVWGRDGDIDERTVDVHVGRLRKALIRGNEPDPIRTVRGAGYVLERENAGPTP